MTTIATDRPLVTGAVPGYALLRGRAQHHTVLHIDSGLHQLQMPGKEEAVKRREQQRPHPTPAAVELRGELRIGFGDGHEAGNQTDPPGPDQRTFTDAPNFISGTDVLLRAQFQP